jgi:hypothetical protein
MVAGDPALLRSFTDEVTAAIPTLQTAADTCSTAVTSYNDAPNDLPGADLSDVGTMYSVDVESLAELAAVPSAFASLIEAADGDATLLSRLDQMLLDTWLATPSFADAEALLDALTGTPGEMADSIRALLVAGGELSDDEVDDLMAAYRTTMGEQYLQVGNTYGGVLITPDNQAAIVWQAVLDRQQWDGALSGATIDQLLDLSARVAVVADDTDFATALFDDLGAADTARLPNLVAHLAWSDQYTTGGHGFDAPALMHPISEALATASGNLPRVFWDDVFAAGQGRDSVEDANLGWWDDHEATVIDDAFPALFLAGGFAPAVAQRAGQLGIDILDGQQADGLWVQVRRGQGSPFYEGSDQMATRWEDRGALLVGSAATTPEAATELLRDERNAAIVTDNAFGRDDNGVGTEHVPGWGAVSDEVGHLIRSGTVDNLAAHPDATREAAANVINNAIDEPPGASHEALATPYAEVATQYLGDFAVDDFYADPASVSDGHLAIGSVAAARFVGLGMGSDEGRAMLTSAHEVVALDIAVGGIEAEYGGVGADWEQQLGKLDAVMLAGELGDDFHSAQQAQRAAVERNAALASGQGALLRAVGLAPHTKVLLVGLQPVADHIRTEYLNDPTNQVEIATSQANVTAATALDHEKRLIATGHLVAALRAEAALPPDAQLSPEMDSVLQVAEAEMSPASLANLRDIASTGGDPQLLDATGGATLADDLDQFREAFAAREEWPVDSDYQDVSVYRLDHLVQFPDGLFVSQ